MDQYLQNQLQELTDFFRANKNDQEGDCQHSLQFRLGQKNQSVKLDFQFQQNQDVQGKQVLQFKTDPQYIFHLKKVLLDLKIFENDQMFTSTDSIQIQIQNNDLKEFIQESLKELQDFIGQEDCSCHLKLQIRDQVKDILEKKSLNMFQIMIEGFEFYLDYKGNSNFNHLMFTLILKSVGLSIDLLKDSCNSNVQMNFKEITEINEFLKSCGIYDFIKKQQSLESLLESYKIFKTSFGQILQELQFLENLEIKFINHPIQFSLNLNCQQKKDQKIPVINQDKIMEQNEYNPELLNQIKQKQLKLQQEKEEQQRSEREEQEKWKRLEQEKQLQLQLEQEQREKEQREQQKREQQKREQQKREQEQREQEQRELQEQQQSYDQNEDINEIQQSKNNQSNLESSLEQSQIQKTQSKRSLQQDNKQIERINKDQQNNEQDQVEEDVVFDESQEDH